MVFNATFNNMTVISWLSILLVEETGVAGENHRPVASNWQTLLHNVVSSTPRNERANCKIQLLYIGCMSLMVTYKFSHQNGRIYQIERRAAIFDSLRNAKKKPHNYILITIAVYKNMNIICLFICQCFVTYTSNIYYFLKSGDVYNTLISWSW